MATIDSKEIIDLIIKQNGYYEDDPQVYMIVEYENAWGGKSYGVTWLINKDRDKYLTPSQYIKNPVVIWRADGRVE